MVSNVANIMTRVVKPEGADLPREMAQKVLTWQFVEQDLQRVSELLEKNNVGTITTEEHSELETLVVLGDLLNILHAKARLSLQHCRGPAKAS